MDFHDSMYDDVWLKGCYCKQLNKVKQFAGSTFLQLLTIKKTLLNICYFNEL